MVDILADTVNFSKASMIPAQHHFDFLTLKHPPAIELSIKQIYTKHQLHTYGSFSEKNIISAALLAAILRFFIMSARHYSQYLQHHIL